MLLKMKSSIIFATLHENYLPQDAVIIKKIDPTIQYIKVYDLQKVFSELKISVESNAKNDSTKDESID
jgi:hypothetical protein